MIQVKALGPLFFMAGPATCTSPCAVSLTFSQERNNWDTELSTSCVQGHCLHALHSPGLGCDSERGTEFPGRRMRAWHATRAVQGALLTCGSCDKAFLCLSSGKVQTQGSTLLPVPSPSPFSSPPKPPHPSVPTPELEFNCYDMVGLLLNGNCRF